MKPLHIAAVGVVVSGVLAGLADGLFADAQSVGPTTRLFADFGPTVVGVGFIFAWLHYDEKEHAYRRSPLLNIGIVLVALVFVPVYLVRSRPSGRRFRAVLGFVAVLVVWITIGRVTVAASEYLGL